MYDVGVGRIVSNAKTGSISILDPLHWQPRLIPKVLDLPLTNAEHHPWKDPCRDRPLCLRVKSYFVAAKLSSTRVHQTPFTKTGIFVIIKHTLFSRNRNKNSRKTTLFRLSTAPAITNSSLVEISPCKKKKTLAPHDPLEFKYQKKNHNKALTKSTGLHLQSFLSSSNTWFKLRKKQNKTTLFHLSTVPTITVSGSVKINPQFLPR